MQNGNEAAAVLPEGKGASRAGGYRGIALMVAAVAVQSCSEAVAKFMTASLPSVEVAWLRYAVFAAIVVVGTFARGERLALRTPRPDLQILRSVTAVGAAIFFIMALSLLPMAEVTAISFVSPLLVTVFSIPILRETVGVRRWIAVAMGMAGVLMVVRPSTATFAVAAAFPLFAAASWALALVVTRLMSASDRPLVSLTYAALVGFAVTSALVPFTWVTPDPKGLLLGLATGIFGTAAQYLTVAALHHERASVLAPLFYGSLVWSILFGYILFGDLPDLWTYAGAATIIAGGLYTLSRSPRRR